MINTRIFTTILSIALFVVLTGCGHEKAEESKPAVQEVHTSAITLTQTAQREIGLKTETVQQQMFTKYLTVPAKVVTNQDNEALVGSLVSGRVYKVLVKAGDYVKAGQVLMLVEGLEIGDIKAGYLAAKANVEFRKANYERQKKLLAENIGSQKNVLEAQNDYDKARADFGAEKNRINAIGLSDNDITNTTNNAAENRYDGALAVKSPLSGVVAERHVVIGQLLDASANAFKIINLGTVWVDGQIHEKDVPFLTGVKQAEFFSTAYPNEPLSGTISYIGQVIDETTRTLTVRAEFKNESRTLKPQMFGELKIPCKKNMPALVVPAEALVKIDNADYVFVRKDSTSFEKKPITIGLVQNEQAEIVRGLAEGDVVVTKGAYYLKGELLKASFGEGE